jgi:hypothetical protein
VNRARSVALLLALAALLSACARPMAGLWNSTLQGGGVQGLNGGGGAVASGGAASATPGPGAAGATGAAGSAAGAAGAAGAPGGGGGGGGGSTAVRPLASYPGVTPTEIQIAFAGKAANCAESNDPQESSDGTLKAKDGQEVQAWVDYVKKYIPLPGGRKLKLVGNTAVGPISMVDDGGNYCPGKAQSAARYVVDQLRPYAVFGSGVNAGEPVFGQTVAQGHIVVVGTMWPTLAPMQALYPYSWGLFGAPDEKLRNLAAWVHKRVQPTQYTPPAGPAVPRVYGMMTFDDPWYMALGDVGKQAFSQYGIQLKVYPIPMDRGQLAQEMGQIALQMKSDNVNTMVWGIGPSVQAVAVSNSFDGADFHPDNLVFVNGVAFIDALYSQSQWQRAMGVINSSIGVNRDDGTHYSNVPENGGAYNAVWLASSQTDGQSAQNSIACGYTCFAALSVIVVGLERSPVNFTPQTWAQGLESTTQPQLRCPVEQLLGRDHPQFTRNGWSRDNPSGASGFTDVHWTAKKSDVGPVGYWDSYDGYNVYFGLNDLPAQPTHDTAADSLPQVQQFPAIGLSPFKSCKSIGLQGDLYQ